MKGWEISDLISTLFVRSGGFGLSRPTAGQGSSLEDAGWAISA